tara:strand:+ start:544 stop:909 length:366 start_codon:yes stop_codon:yes gene_type:complete
MNMKLLKAKSYWIKLMCEYYFEQKNENCFQKNEAEKFFINNIQNALKLNEKNFIEYLVSEGWTPSISECYDTYFEEIDIEEEKDWYDPKKHKYSKKQIELWMEDASEITRKENEREAKDIK